MRKTDIVFLIIAVVLILVFGSSYMSARFLIKLPIGIITLLFVIYWKIMPYKNQLSANYRRYYDITDQVLQPIFKIFSRFNKVKLGATMQMESAPFIICSILIIILILL